MKKPVAVMLLALITFAGYSQEQLGLRLSNYSGINGTLLNPAFNVNSPLRWDINLIAAGVFVENNYVYIKNASTAKIIRNHSGFRFAEEVNDDPTVFEGLYYDFTTGNRRKQAYVNEFVTGPSAMFHIKEHTFGVFFNFRSTVSINRLSPSSGYYQIVALQAGESMEMKPFKVAGLVWSEAGFNYGRKIYNHGKHTINLGGSIKYLQGYEAFYFKNHEPVDITQNIDSLLYQDAHVTFGLASGALNVNPSNPYSPKVRGQGVSIDIGAVYYIQTKNEKRPFDWKMGLSLLDFGRIAFDQDAQAHEISTERAFDFIQAQYANIQNADDAFRVLSFQSLLNSNASLVSNRFGIWTPAGISFFAERAFTNHFYVNGTVVRRLRFSGPVPERDNIWAITPRYEHRWYEVSVPLVLYNDKDIRIGTAIRLGPLVIGSDNLTSWFGSSDFTGSDIYFALKINPISLNGDKIHKNKFSGNPVDCFKF